MDLAAGRRVKMPARTLARRRLRELKPIARELKCTEHLNRIEFILDSGTGAARQLQVFNANRDIVEVAHEIANATEAI
jgi:gamma-glutamyl:cysteine ligase YbdK (ATP-grasp superfamily)